MNYRIEPNRLVITVRPDEQAILRSAAQDSDFDSDRNLHASLEWLVTNHDFVWIDPGITGDLTDAPMLALLGDMQPGPDDNPVGSGLFPVGQWVHGGQVRKMYQPVLRRWAFMKYQVTSPQRELAEKGECVFEGSQRKCR